MQRGARARSTKQKAHIQRYEQLCVTRKARSYDQSMCSWSLLAAVLGRTTVELKDHLRKAYGDKALMKDFTYIFLKNDRVGIIGPERQRQVHVDEDDRRLGTAGLRYQSRSARP